VNPRLVACSFIASGLRLFDISDLLHPREVGYFVAPTTPNTETGYTESDYAMSQPAFDVARHEIWYTDGGTGFYVVKVADAVWPGGQTSTPAPVCSLAPGRLSARRLGPVALGMSRTAAARALHAWRACPHPALRVAYAGPRLLAGLPARTRRALRGRLAAAASSSPLYALRGVTPGMRARAAGRKVRLRHGVKAGGGTWYVVSNGPQAGLVAVRHGVVVAVGIADRRLTGGAARLRRLVSGL
jgi:hypothetical protein